MMSGLLGPGAALVVPSSMGAVFSLPIVTMGNQADLALNFKIDAWHSKAQDVTAGATCTMRAKCIARQIRQRGFTIRPVDSTYRR